MSATDKRDIILANSVDTLVLKINGVDKSAMLQEFSQDFGDNSAIIFTIPHGLTGLNLVPTVKLNSTGEIVKVLTTIDATNVVITFVGSAPTTNQFKVIVK